MPKHILAGLFPVFFLVPVGLQAEIITLISGHEITGDILEDEEGELHVLLPNGGIQVLDKGDILRVVDPNNPPPIARKPRELEKQFIDRLVLPMNMDPEQPDLEKEWKWKPLVQSTIWPGWGQRTLGGQGLGWSITAAGMAIGGYYFSSRTQWADAQTTYSDITLPAILSQQGNTGFLINYAVLEQKRDRLLALESQTNTTVAVISAFWLLNMYDTYAKIQARHARAESGKEPEAESAYRTRFIAIPTDITKPGMVFAFQAMF